ncbi:MAG TPA: alkaline phosphatase family protein [Acidimicrobiia bacterium]|nr:alkaline phosphatase family protein [Acidimicrobiia bacterium]
MSIRRTIVAACALTLVAAGVTTTGAGAQPGGRVPPPIRNVFVVNLENKGYDETFGPASPATYLTQVLRPRGVLLTQYYGTAHASLGNYIAQISGQGPNAATQSDCQFYTDFRGAGTVAPQQAVGQGCVYPASVQTLADQFTAGGLNWKGYMEDMGNSPTEPATCRHPALNTQDETQIARAGDQYAARHNPFVYFHSIIDSPACSERVVPLDRLDADLARRTATPNLGYITPNLCNDGHDDQCVDGREGGLVAADQWLAAWIPKILKSRAFRQAGLLIVTFDESEANDASACCGEGPGPNSPLPGITGRGGGRTGAVVVSPFIRPGGWNDTGYNHYSLLCSIEEIFGLPKLGYARQPGMPCFGTDVYTTLN